MSRPDTFLLLGMKKVQGYDDGYAFTSPVKSFRPNELGLFDMSGNVNEWTADWFSEDYYAASPRHNPGGSKTVRIQHSGEVRGTPFPRVLRFREAGEHGWVSGSHTPPVQRNLVNKTGDASLLQPLSGIPRLYDND